MDKVEIRKRRRARRMVLQALYQWLMTNQEPTEIEAQFCAVNPMDKADEHYFHRLLYDIIARIEEIEAAFVEFLDRPIQTLNPIERTVLRLSTYELLFLPELPYRIILDESVALSRMFGSQDGYRYVNGVLNNLAKKIRAAELN